jgi:hypothetical protein
MRCAARPSILTAGSLVVIGLAILMSHSNPVSAQQCAPLSGKYTVTGTASGVGGAVSLSMNGTINSGGLTCFATGKGSYSATAPILTKGRLSVHSDWTEYWSSPTAVYLPALPNTGSFASDGYTIVAVACTSTGSYSMPAPATWDLAPDQAPNHQVQCSGELQGGVLFVWVVDGARNVVFEGTGTWSGRAP